MNFQERLQSHRRRRAVQRHRADVFWFIYFEKDSQKFQSGGFSGLKIITIFPLRALCYFIDFLFLFSFLQLFLYFSKRLFSFWELCVSFREFSFTRRRLLGNTYLDKRGWTIHFYVNLVAPDSNVHARSMWSYPIRDYETRCSWKSHEIWIYMKRSLVFPHFRWNEMISWIIVTM